MLNLNRVAETAAGGSISTIVKKLASLSLSQLSKLREASSNIESLEDELQIIHAVLLDLSNEEHPDHQLKLWMNKVRELAYDVEDAIDMFVLASENEHVCRIRESQNPNFIESIMVTIRSCTDRIKSLPSDYRIATKIQRLKDRVVAAEDQSKRFKTVGNSDFSSYDAIAIRDVASYSNPARIVGVDAPSEEIIRMLTEGSSSSARQHMVVTIVGFGGLGKTTLAKHVFDKIAAQFNCTAFVSVSRKPNIKKVLRDILLDFGSNDRLKDLRQLDQLQLAKKLRKCIIGKKYLVVVDDIWNKDDWLIINGALSSDNCGGRIIVTTRKNDVAKECCLSTAGFVYNMKPLDKDNSNRLFLEKAFGHKGCPPNLKCISDKILKKCAGSPLAILTLSGLLVNKVTSYQWEDILNSLRYAVPEQSDVVTMRRILSFSYFDLPQHLRTCLLYLSIFPEDTVIKRKPLIHRWIAEGFVRTEYGSSKTKIGEQYFNELISRCLIQPLDLGYDGQARACRVHDTILDFIVSKSIEENFVTLLGVQDGRPQNKVRRLSIQNIPDVTELAGHDLSHVRSLNFFVNNQQIPCSVPLLTCASLRVLDLHDYALPASISEDIEHLITGITHLFHLKYLDISGFYGNRLSTYFDRLITGIANLHWLETIDLRGTPLSKLPTGIYKLKQLVCLFLPRGVIMPDGIGQMKALEELKVISVDTCSSLEFLQELGQLTKLRLISIYIERDPTILQQESILISSLCKLGMWNLHSLTIDMFDNWNDGSAMHCLHESDGHSWQAAVQSLRKFSMKSGYFSKVPDWMGSLNHLEKLVLGIEEMGQKELDTLANLQSLLYLFLMLVEYPKEGLTFRRSKGFQCLRYLGTHCYPRGVMLAFESGSMLRLEHLQFDIYTCDSTICSSYNFGIEHLTSLTTVDVTIRYTKQHVGGTEKAAETAIRNAVKKLSKNPTLRIDKQPLLQ